MVIFLVFSAFSLLSAGVAAWSGSMRHAALALWILGLCCGGIYLCVGDEIVAVVQWIASTLVSASFLLYSAMLGEADSAYGAGGTKATGRERMLRLLPVLLGAGFAGIVYLGSGGLSSERFDAQIQASDLMSVGKALTERHFLSLEVLGLLFLLALVGGGVIARPEKTEGSDE